MDNEIEKRIETGIQEMRRGTLTLAILTRVDTPQYGYMLIESLAEFGLTVESNTLYPLLRRLEKQGLLESIWQVETSRPRRYYQITAMGIEYRQALTHEWNQIGISMNRLIEKEDKDADVD